MKIQVTGKVLFRVFALALFILLAPFAFELVIMAEIVGVEAAIAFLFTWGKSVALSARDRVIVGFRIIFAFIRPEPSEVMVTHERQLKMIVYPFIGLGLTTALVISIHNIFILLSWIG